MKRKTIEKIDNLIEKLCDIGCKRADCINTDKVIALTETIGKVLAARAALIKD